MGWQLLEGPFAPSQEFDSVDGRFDVTYSIVVPGTRRHGLERLDLLI
jgi:hypothetical protein